MRWDRIKLFEYNPNRIKNEFGERLVQKWFDEGTPKVRQIAQLHQGNFNDSDPDAVLNGLIKYFEWIDPSPTNEYTQWLVTRYAGKKGGINRFEDLSRASLALNQFDEMKKRGLIPVKDINQYKTLNDLEDEIDQYRQVKSKTQKDKDKEKEFYKNNEAKLLYNDDELKVVVPKTEEASCYFGRNTRWCTASISSENYFDYYNAQGNLFIIIDKKNNERFQLHFGTEQYMNEKDRPIYLDKLVKRFPILKDIFHKIAYRKFIIELLDKKFIDKDYMFKAVEHNPWNLRYFKNAPESIQWKAIENDLGVFQYIEHPTKEQLEFVISQVPDVLTNLKSDVELDIDLVRAAIWKMPSVVVRSLERQDAGYIIQNFKKIFQSDLQWTKKLLSSNHYRPPRPALLSGMLKYFDYDVFINFIEDLIKEDPRYYKMIDWRRLKEKDIASLQNMIVTEHPMAAGSIFGRLSPLFTPSKIAMVRNDGSTIIQLREPSQEVQLAAVQEWPYAIFFIDSLMNELDLNEKAVEIAKQKIDSRKYPFKNHRFRGMMRHWMAGELHHTTTYYTDESDEWKHENTLTPKILLAKKPELIEQIDKMSELFNQDKTEKAWDFIRNGTLAKID